MQTRVASKCLVRMYRVFVGTVDGSDPLSAAICGCSGCETLSKRPWTNFHLEGKAKVFNDLPNPSRVTANRSTSDKRILIHERSPAMIRIGGRLWCAWRRVCRMNECWLTLERKGSDQPSLISFPFSAAAVRLLIL